MSVINRFRQKAMLCTEAMPALCRGSKRRSAEVTSIVRLASNALAGMASRKNNPKAARGPGSESNISQVRTSSQSIIMKAGKVGRKNRIDTIKAVPAENSAIRQRRVEDACGRGGKLSLRKRERAAGAP